MNIKRDVNKKYCALQHFIREGSEYDPLDRVRPSAQYDPSAPDRQTRSWHPHPVDHRRIPAAVRAQGDHQPQKDPVSRQGANIDVYGLGKNLSLYR